MGTPGDPSVNLVPGKNFVTPPRAPDYLGVGAASPTDQIQIAVTSGYDKPSTAADPNAIQRAAATIAKKQAETDASSTGTGPKRTATPAPAPATTPPAPPAAAPAQPASPSPDLHPAPSPNAHVAPPAPTGDLQTFGQQVAAKYGVPWDIFYWLIAGESNWDPNTRDSPKGAVGIAQFVPGTATEQGVTNPRDPRIALEGAAKYLAKLHQMSGGTSWVPAITAYNQGESRMFEPPAGETLAVPAYATAYHNAGYTLSEADNQRRAETIRRGYETKAANASKAAQEARELLAGEPKDFAEAMRRIRAAQDKADEAQHAAMKAIAQEPKQPVIDGVKHMSSIAVIVGLLGGLMTKAPMLASTNAAAAAIEAYNAKDLRAFNIAHGLWKDQTDYLFKIADMQANRVRDILADEKMGLEEKRAKLDVTLRAMGLQSIADDARINGAQSAADWAYKMKDLEYRHQETMRDRDRPENWYDPTSKTWKRVYPLSGHVEEVPGGLVPQSAAISAQRRDQISPEAKTRADLRFQQWVSIPENAAKSDQEKQEQLWKLQDEAQSQVSAAKRGTQGGLLDKDTLSTMADQYIAGDATVFAGLGYGNIGATNRAALRTMVSQKMMARATEQFRDDYGRDPNDNEKERLSSDIGRRLAVAIAEFGGLRQAERTAMGRVAQLTIGAEEAKQFTPIALDMSDKVDRTRFPSVNKLALAAAEGAGGTDVIRFNEANVALIDAYAQVIGRGSAQLTDAAREQAINLLNTHWSKEQYKAAVDQINVEIEGALRAPEEVLRKFREAFGVNGRLPDLRPGAAPQVGAGTTGGGSITPPHPPVPAPLRAQENDLDWSPTLRQFRNRRTNQIFDETGKQLVP